MFTHQVSSNFVSTHQVSSNLVTMYQVSLNWVSTHQVSSNLVTMYQVSPNWVSTHQVLSSCTSTHQVSPNGCPLVGCLQTSRPLTDKGGVRLKIKRMKCRRQNNPGLYQSHTCYQPIRHYCSGNTATYGHNTQCVRLTAT